MRYEYSYGPQLLFGSIVILFASTFVLDAHAEDPPTVSCNFSEPDLDSDFFPGIQERARALNVDPNLCLALIGGDATDFESAQQERYRDFGVSTKASVRDVLSGPQFENWERPFDDWIQRMTFSDFANKDIASFSAVSPIGGEFASQYLFFFSDTNKKGILKDSDDATCAIKGENLSCKEILEDLEVAINDYNVSYKEQTLRKTGEILDGLSSEWDDFLTNGRSQTLLDLAVTSYLERKHFRQPYLVGPPKRQWSVLHPSLVIEHASDAMSGEKDKMTVAVEWIGVNWWGDDSPFGIPFGVSLASVYADRPNLDSVGHGLMVHIDNRYSLGWASRSGDNSFYFSLDLLKFIEDKETQFQRYKDDIKAD
jgi:hypothetical protein